jgi:uncharacterized cupredoxin-like copper-binding protein
LTRAGKNARAPGVTQDDVLIPTKGARMRTSVYAAVGLAALALGAAGCGSDDNNDNSSASTPASTPATPPASSTPAKSTPAAGGGGGAVSIGESEYKLTPADATAKAGTVTVNVKNDGQIVHNLEIEGNGVEKKSADIEPGSSGKVTVNLKPGKYEMYCAIDGHKDLGMKGDITVT